ncbi:hypothetical protein DPEC_G00379290, partial [Dallia pectoralis]
MRTQTGNNNQGLLSLNSLPQHHLGGDEPLMELTSDEEDQDGEQQPEPLVLPVTKDGEDGQHGQNTRYPQPRLEERRQMVSTQTMTEDEPPPPVPEVRNYKQTIMVEVPREQRRGQRSRESTSGIREPQQGEPTLQTIDEDPGEATTNQEGPFVPPVVMTPRYQGTPSQSDLSSEEELS